MIVCGNGRAGIQIERENTGMVIANMRRAHRWIDHCLQRPILIRTNKTEMHDHAVGLRGRKAWQQNERTQNEKKSDDIFHAPINRQRADKIPNTPRLGLIPPQQTSRPDYPSARSSSREEKSTEFVTALAKELEVIISQVFRLR